MKTKLSNIQVAKLQKLGFINSEKQELLPRIIMSIEGMEKMGKSHFALSAPGPIGFFNLDEGTEGVIEKRKKEKEIYIIDLQVPDTAKYNEKEVTELSRVEWGRFNAAFSGLLAGTEVRTLIVDTATELRELQLMSWYGKSTQIMPYMYRGPNAEFRKLIRGTLKYNKNVIFLHKMKSVYVNDKRTGEWELSGFNDTGYLVQVNTRVYRYDIADGGDFAIYIKDCRQNPEMAGQELTGEMCNFPILAQMVLPDIDPINWE